MNKYTRVLYIEGEEWVVDENGHRVRKISTYYGNSTRPRPTYEDGARDADRLVENDTGNVFVFDEDIKDWAKVPAGV